MTILSQLCLGSRIYLCGVSLAGATALGACGAQLNSNEQDDMAALPQADGGTSGFTAASLSSDGTGIKFDDGIYSMTLHKVIVPGAGTGNLFLIDPDTMAVSAITGFAKPPAAPPSVPSGGVTSVSEGNGLLYATDPTDQKLYVVDPATQSIVTSVALAGSPDYVRYVATTNEVWVTEPDTVEQIEVFSVKTDPRKPKHSVNIKIPGGPEGLYINNTLKVAYANGSSTSTMAIDLQRHTVKTAFTSGCAEPKNILADEASGLAFVGCGEGGVGAVDLKQGKMVSQLRVGSKTDSFGFSPTLRHLYLPGTSLTIVGVTTTGTLSKLTEVVTPGGTSKHAVSDGQRHAWDLKADTGQAMRIDDDYPASN